nr:hypothetical protein GCM10020093_093880 [Planobispora longispora]
MYAYGILTTFAISAVIWGLPSTAAESGRETPGRFAGAAPFGVFLASDERGVERLPLFEAWLDGRAVTVGRTYLPGENWRALEGPGFILDPWTRWRAARPERVLALNVPMLAPNEGTCPTPPWRPSWPRVRTAPSTSSSGRWRTGWWRAGPRTRSSFWAGR